MTSLSRIVRSAILTEAADDPSAKSVAIALKASEILKSDPIARTGDAARRKQALQMLDNYVSGRERDPQVAAHLRELSPYTSIESVASALRKFYKGTTPPTRWPLSAMTVLGEEYDSQAWPPYLEEIIAKAALEAQKVTSGRSRSGMGDIDVSPEELSAAAPLRDVDPYASSFQDPDAAPERETGLSVSRPAPSVGSLGALRRAFRAFSTAFISRFDDVGDSGVDSEDVVEQIRVINSLFDGAIQMREGRSRSLLYLSIFEGISPFGMLGRALSGGQPDIQSSLQTTTTQQPPPPAELPAQASVTGNEDERDVGDEDLPLSPAAAQAYNTFIESYENLKPRLEDEVPDVAGEILSEIDALVQMFEAHFGIKPEEM